ncbi:hypothetical protein [Nocardia bhagyanarayanae]|uniref:Copper resistance protein D n=1 Tax=Nocardia bhagyanarayanae TaxID=1215925 RepID=A0A543EXN5_9NOCA|nr:hypothetical protein [Nocardia bhagyanarayanae]TQM26347.1 hypothetical protein FB390_6536 [Nocardia bhagyanarayanae]
MSIDVAKVTPATRGGAVAPALAALSAGGFLAVAIWVSSRLDVSEDLHRVALFVHLAALVVGLGAVLVGDYAALLWLTGRVTTAQLLHDIGRLHLPIWVGLAGLVGSGMLLEPEFEVLATRVKLALVAVLMANGVQAMALERRMAAAGPHLGFPLVLRGIVTALVSQGCWWTAMWIGFTATQS